mmetsp:Transcript_31134/g.74859  ORF Transcript_31134/g.74859 Transcript_31134/m.74859 type:complete len:83 (-) Transcript_31134:147-395(-)
MLLVSCEDISTTSLMMVIMPLRQRRLRDLGLESGYEESHKHMTLRLYRHYSRAVPGRSATTRNTFVPVRIHQTLGVSQQHYS